MSKFKNRNGLNQYGQNKPHIFLAGAENKFCSKCKQYHPVAEFVKNKNTWDGLNPSCKKSRVRVPYCKKKRREQYKKHFKKTVDYLKKNRDAILKKSRQDYEKRLKATNGNIWKLTPSERYRFSGFVIVETSDDCVLPRGK